MKKIKHFINDFVNNHKKTVALAGILTVAGVGDVLGQTSPWVVTDRNWADTQRERTTFHQNTSNMDFGVMPYAKLSVSEVARISPWMKIGSKSRFSESELSIRYEFEGNNSPREPGGQRPAHGWRRFDDNQVIFLKSGWSSNFMFTAGADFRITNNNLIRVSGGTEGWYGGFIRRQPLSRTMSMDFEVGIRTGSQGSDQVIIIAERDVENLNPGFFLRDGLRDAGVNISKQEVSAGIRLRKNLGHNISAEAGVSFARNIGYESISPPIGEQLNEVRRREMGVSSNLPIPTPDRTVSLNNLNFSIGIHKNFRVGNVPQVMLERRQRQPRRTAITCPHMQPRPWETVQPFNHPIAR